MHVQLKRSIWFIVTLSASLSAALTDAHCGDLRFKKHTVNPDVDYSAAALVDVNHDGRLDIVCGGDWYESPNWKRHFLAKIPRIGGRPDGFAHQPFDVNRDGWADVVTVNYRSRTIKWMQHPGVGLGAWQSHVAAEPGAMETGRLIDVDGDGNLDLLPNGAKFAAWWELRWKTPAEPGRPAWIRHDLPKQAAGHGIGFGDIDGDGRGDIVGQRGWLRAPVDARNGRWQWNADFAIERGSTPMLVVDPDGDGDNDIVWCSAHGFGVYWLEQSSTANGGRTWTRHAIDTSWSQGHSPLWVDLDGDGRNELVAGKRYMSHGGKDPGAYDPIAVYRYQFDKPTRTWERWCVSAPGQRVGMGLDPKAGDIDNDGDLDLLAAGRSGLYWLENCGPGTSTPALSSTLQAETEEAKISSFTASREGWYRHRSRFVAALDRRLGSAGKAVTENARVPLALRRERDVDQRQQLVERVDYQINASARKSATLYKPLRHEKTLTGVVCMSESSERGGEIATELVTRGFAVLVPESSQGNDLMLGHRVWEAMRAADVLQAEPNVNAERIAYFGSGDNLGLYVAAIDQRFAATVVHVASNVDTSAGDSPNAYGHLLAAIAPRAVHFSLPKQSSVRQLAESAVSVFELLKKKTNLVISESHSEQRLYDWLQKAR